MLMDQDPLQHLRRQIDSGRLPNHSKLPPERDLAEQYGVPRTVVRKALAILEAEGKIRRHVGRGTFVGSAPRDRLERGGAEAWSASPIELIELRLAKKFWDEIAKTSPRRAKVVKIFKEYAAVMEKAGRPYRYT